MTALIVGLALLFVAGLVGMTEAVSVLAGRAVLTVAVLLIAMGAVSLRRRQQRGVSR